MGYVKFNINCISQSKRQGVPVDAMMAYGGVWDLLHSFLLSVLDHFQVAASCTPVNGPQVALNTKLSESRLQILFQNTVTLIDLSL